MCTRKWLAAQNDKNSKRMAAKVEVTRDELLKSAQSAYVLASKIGGDSYASVTSALAKATDCCKDTTFNTWSDSELKAYLDTYGVHTHQSSTSDEMRAAARNLANYFRYGTTTPQATIYAKLLAGARWLLDQLRIGAASVRKEAVYEAEKASDGVQEDITYATNRAEEKAENANDHVKEEL
jgi:hypothetical protein